MLEERPLLMNTSKAKGIRALCRRSRLYVGVGTGGVSRLKWDGDGWLALAKLMLLLEFLVASFDGDGETDLGLLLQRKAS